MRRIDTDVAVVGSGVAGMTMALLLARSGLRVVLVEKNAATVETPRTPDPRVLALTLASWRIFRHLRVWDVIPGDQYCRFRHMRVWEETGNAVLNFDCADICAPALGFILQQHLLATGLERVMDGNTGITLLHGRSVAGIEQGTDDCTLVLDDDNRICSRLLIAADGSNSLVRELAGIPVTRLSYEQTALTCTVNTSLAHGETARQKFLPTGPLAFLPLHDVNSCSVVWSCDNTLADELMQLDDSNFTRRLEEAFDNEAGEITSIGKRSAFPLNRSHAQNYCLPRIALIGDAAHSVHPLAGQGANMGLLDAACLAQVLTAAGNDNRDIGSYRVLRKYERWRKGENHIMMTVLDTLKYIYAGRHSPLPELRNSGVKMLNSLYLLKNIVMKHASGLSGDLPEIAKI